MVRARKRTQPKGKAQPATSTKAKATTPAPGHNDTHSSSPPNPRFSSQAKTAVTAQQSSDVVQTLLFSAASTILWMRDLLPDEYFRTAFYASINKHCSYHDFTQGNDEGAVAQGNRSRPKGYHLRLLKRNVSIRGDRIIKWLETGVFEAIQRGYLAQLQICVFADEERPTEVLEMYCFHLVYPGWTQDGSNVVNLEIEDSQTKKTVSLKDTREALNTVVRNMVSLNGTMPHLPERCYMSLYLVWNERRPSGYQPPGFHSSRDVNISFPTTEGWTMDTSTCGQVKAGFRTVDLGITYTKGMTFDNDGEAIVMPDFTYGEKFNRLEPFNVPTSNQQHQDESLDNDAQELPTPRPSSVVADEPDLSMTTTETRYLPTRLPDSGTHTLRHSSVDASAYTQDKNDLSRLKALQPLEPHQMHDTQLVPRPPSTPSQPAQGLPKEHQELGHPRTRTSQRSRPSESIIISCECGSKETSNVVQCHSCNGWQHAQCYAYDGVDDVRMSRERMCYTCLLGNATSHQLNKVKTLTRTRQVIHCIQVRGLTSSNQITKTLGCTRSDVAKLLGNLKQNNVVLLKDSRSSEHVSMVPTEAAKQKLADLYLDPSKHVDDLVAEAVAGERATQSTPGRKRKNHGWPDGDSPPKTPRLSRPHPSLAFDSNVVYTPPDSFAGQGGDGRWD
ncbi:DNA-binding protein [Karstenula rhodostoma CBS 690.94]|uniref:DNA-binding protein n=1 Tax=Karstenula rhodostoma CBS 690.94 TaxID=1392251 RepID=A0A9P4PSH5_9PLEO|nr:DNA-binding protein [Karstenula rhodostoma CBS 690.94]